MRDTARLLGCAEKEISATNTESCRFFSLFSLPFIARRRIDLQKLPRFYLKQTLYFAIALYKN